MGCRHGSVFASDQSFEFPKSSICFLAQSIESLLAFANVVRALLLYFGKLPGGIFRLAIGVTGFDIASSLEISGTTFVDSSRLVILHSRPWMRSMASC